MKKYFFRTCLIEILFSDEIKFLQKNSAVILKKEMHKLKKIVKQNIYSYLQNKLSFLIF